MGKEFQKCDKNFIVSSGRRRSFAQFCNTLKKEGFGRLIALGLHRGYVRMMQRQVARPHLLDLLLPYMKRSALILITPQHSSQETKGRDKGRECVRTGVLETECSVWLEVPRLH